MKPDLPDVNLGDPNLYEGRIRLLYDNLIGHGNRERHGSAPRDPPPFSFSAFESKVNAALALGFCYHCRRPLEKWDWSPNHMRALSLGGRCELSNIRIICSDCDRKKGRMLDDEFHRKVSSTRPSHMSDVDRAARGTASVRLNAAQIRACVKMWANPSIFPKVAAFARIIERAFDGELTSKQALKEMAELTGEYAALKLRREKATGSSTTVSPPQPAHKSTRTAVDAEFSRPKDLEDR